MGSFHFKINSKYALYGYHFNVCCDESIFVGSFLPCVSSWICDDEIFRLRFVVSVSYLNQQAIIWRIEFFYIFIQLIVGI